MCLNGTLKKMEVKIHIFVKVSAGLSEICHRKMCLSPPAADAFYES